MNIEPLNATVFIILDEGKEKVTQGGIFIPTDTDEVHVDVGTIEALGPLAFLDDEHSKMNIKVGDKVVFDRYSGKEIRDGITGEITHRIMPDIAIWGRVSPEESK
jgi:co-chaperonin GroES (HSP10)